LSIGEITKNALKNLILKEITNKMNKKRSRLDFLPPRTEYEPLKQSEQNTGGVDNNTFFEVATKKEKSNNVILLNQTDEGLLGNLSEQNKKNKVNTEQTKKLTRQAKKTVLKADINIEDEVDPFFVASDENLLNKLIDDNKQYPYARPKKNRIKSHQYNNILPTNKKQNSGLNKSNNSNQSEITIKKEIIYTNNNETTNKTSNTATVEENQTVQSIISKKNEKPLSLLQTTKYCLKGILYLFETMTNDMVETFNYFWLHKSKFNKVVVFMLGPFVLQWLMVQYEPSIAAALSKNYYIATSEMFVGYIFAFATVQLSWFGISQIFDGFRRQIKHFVDVGKKVTK